MSIKTSILKSISSALVVALLSSSVAFAQATAPAPTPAPKAPVTAPVAPAAPKAPVAPAVATPAAKAATPAAAPATKAQLINLNTATVEQLDGLPQIGAARAKAIVDARAKGKFKNWDDFVARNVVPGNAEAAIKDKITF